MNRTITTKEFAELLGVSKCTIAGYCLGDNGMPKVKTPGKKEVKFDLEKCYRWAQKNDRKKLASKLGDILEVDFWGNPITNPEPDPRGEYENEIEEQTIKSDNGKPFPGGLEEIMLMLNTINRKLDDKPMRKRNWRHYSRSWKRI